MTVPTWYNDNHYISEKVDECNTIKFGAVEGEEFTPWTTQTVRDFMAGAYGEESYSPWMGYDNFVTSGNAENCSPNPLFDVMQYVYAKAAQLNAMNDGAGYGVNANNWTGQLVLDFFKANNISAWDHFTTAGQFERVNPSNAMDLSAFLTAKAAQCNELQFDDKSDWTPESVLAYYQEHGLNAVEVANSANDPLVTPVPAENAVTVPTNLNPWGTQGPLNVVPLEQGPETVSDEGVPTNFTGIVESAESKSTFNTADVIKGTNDQDVLTVAMNADFKGMSKDGSVTGVPTVDLTDTAGKDVTFNSKGIEGVTTWNVDGNVSLSNLEAPGITVNLQDVDTSGKIDLDFVDASVVNTDDALTLGLNNVFIPGRINLNGTDQPAQPVSIAAAGIEDVTLNSTGINQNKVDLNGIDYMRSLDIKGDASLQATATDTQLTAIDASEATGNLTLQHGNKALATATLGSGNDVLTSSNVAATATIDGGDGNDTLNMSQATGEYTLNMTNVQTLGLTGNNNNVTIQGNNVDGMENLQLANTSQNITVANFEQSQLNVNVAQVSGSGDNYNNSVLYIDNIDTVDFNVGDGSKYTDDTFAGGQLRLGNTTTLNINVNDGIESNPDTLFNAPVIADKVQELSLNAAKGSSITIGDNGVENNGGQAFTNLSALSSVTATGYGVYTLGTTDDSDLIGTQSSAITVDTSAMANGSFTGVFQDNVKGGTLTVTGGNLAPTMITADASFSSVKMTSGQAADTLTLECGPNGTAWNTTGYPTTSGDLGTGANDTLIINGQPYVDTPNGRVWANFSNIAGVEKIVFTDSRAPQWASSFSTDAADAGDMLILPAGVTVEGVQYGNTGLTYPGTTGNDDFHVDVPYIINHNADFTWGGEGGADTFDGVINNEYDSVTLQAEQGNPDQVAGSVTVKFATASADNPPTLSKADADNTLYVAAVKDLTVESGSLANGSVTGVVGNVAGNFTWTTGTAVETDQLDSITAAGNVTLKAQSKSDFQAGTGANGAVTGAITSTTGVVQVNATPTVLDVLLGDIAGSSVLVGYTQDETTGAVARTDLENNGHVVIADIDATINVNNETVYGDVNVAATNTKDVTIASNETISANDVNVVVDNDGNFTLGAVQGYNQVVDGTTDQATINITTTSDGTATIGALATAGGAITVNANNGVSGTPAAAIIGAVTSQNGQVDITAGQNVSTLEIGAIDAGSGAVNIDANNKGTTNIAEINTTGTAEVNVADSNGASALVKGNIGELTYTGNDLADTIGFDASAHAYTFVTVHDGTEISTSAGNDTIGVTAEGSGVVTINPGTSNGGNGDIVNFNFNNNTSELLTVDINLESGKDSIALNSIVNTGMGLISVEGFQNTIDGDVFNASNISKTGFATFRSQLGASSDQKAFISKVLSVFGIEADGSDTSSIATVSTGTNADNSLVLSGYGEAVDGLYAIQGTVTGTNADAEVASGATLIQILGATDGTGISFGA